LKAELTPWITAFQEKHGRKPTVDDARSTGIDWIRTTFEEYSLLRRKLLAEIPVMRSTMAAAQARGPGAAPAKARSSRGSATADEIMNSNRPALSRMEASTRVSAALNYKKERLRQEEARRVMAATAVGTTAAAATAAPGGVPASVQAPANAKVADAPADGLDRLASAASRAAVKSGAGNSRARSALLNAMQYKKKRAANDAIKQGAAAPGVQPNSALAVRLVSVEGKDGKTIGGVNYEKAEDASQAKAGKSVHIEAGRMPVTSYRRFEGDEVVPSAAALPASAPSPIVGDGGATAANAAAPSSAGAPRHRSARPTGDRSAAGSHVLRAGNGVASAQTSAQAQAQGAATSQQRNGDQSDSTAQSRIGTVAGSKPAHDSYDAGNQGTSSIGTMHAGRDASASGSTSAGASAAASSSRNARDGPTATSAPCSAPAGSATSLNAVSLAADDRASSASASVALQTSSELSAAAQSSRIWGLLCSDSSSASAAYADIQRDALPSLACLEESMVAEDLDAARGGRGSCSVATSADVGMPASQADPDAVQLPPELRAELDTEILPPPRSLGRRALSVRHPAATAMLLELRSKQATATAAMAHAAASAALAHTGKPAQGRPAQRAASASERSCEVDRDNASRAAAAREAAQLAVAEFETARARAKQLLSSGRWGSGWRMLVA
jgi:trimeric autotransporter adhesin